MLFDPNYAFNIVLPILLGGVVVTLGATLGGMVFALIGGLFLAVVRMSRTRVLSTLAFSYVQIIRTTPLLIQLYFLFYVLPKYGLTLSPLLTGIVGLGNHYATYTSEVYRAGIQSVLRGQWEAATALNLSARRTWLAVILPQAIPPILPPLGNYAIGMFKDTALLFTITVPELMGAAIFESGRTYRFFEPLTLVGLIYTALSYASALGVGVLEARFGRLRRA
jgi:polar amino acid transport system permease protein